MVDPQVRKAIVALADALAILANSDPHPSVTQAVHQRCAEAIKALDSGRDDE